MNRNITLASIALVVCLTLTAVAPIGAVAQANETGNQTTTSSDGTTVQTSIQLSPTTEVTEWTYYDANATFEITVRSKTPTRLSVIDAGSLVQQLSEADGETSATATTRGFNLNRGTRTLSFDATEVDGEAAVSLSATGGNQLAVLTSGAIRSSRAPVAYGTAQSIAVGAAVVASGGTFWYVRRKRNEKKLEVRREL